MALKDALLPEFDQEMAQTRRTLERIADDRLAWRPHPKSATMGWLATHLATIPSWVLEAIEKDSVDISPPGETTTPTPQAESRQQALAMFDANVAAARRTIDTANDDRLLQPWSLLAGGKTIFTMPRTVVLRSFVMNHIIHHRAQLGVYLRMNDIPVPAIYGPSADEAGM